MSIAAFASHHYSVQHHSASPSFVEVALPLPLRQTFTYLLPEGLRETVKTGSRLLVPFGTRHLTGYAVALHTTLDPELEIEADALKEAIELLDEEPLLTEEILKLTQWTADYYASSWGEVLKASLPAGINASVEQVVTITAKGRDEIDKNFFGSDRQNEKILQSLERIGRDFRQRIIEKIRRVRIKKSRP